MEIEAKIRALEEKLKHEKSIYKKVYILAWLQKLKNKYKPKKITIFIKSPAVEILKLEKKKNVSKRNKKVVLLEDDGINYRIFNSMLELAEFLNVSRETLYTICNEYRKNRKGIKAVWFQEFLDMKNNNKNPWDLFLKPKQEEIRKSKRIVQLENRKIVKEWKNVDNASKELHISKQGIYNILQKKTKNPKYHLEIMENKEYESSFE